MHILVQKYVFLCLTNDIHIHCNTSAVCLFVGAVVEVGYFVGEKRRAEDDYILCGLLLSAAILSQRTWGRVTYSDDRAPCRMHH